MGFIPKKDDQKESVGVISVVLVHWLFGLGILFIGQKTKNTIEF
ncbi:MAG: hypothetical protein ABIJ10_06740 [Candidatus Micrarchaeota archaeon]